MRVIPTLNRLNSMLRVPLLIVLACIVSHLSVSYVQAISDGGVDAGGTFDPNTSNQTAPVPLTPPVPPPSQTETGNLNPPPAYSPGITFANTSTSNSTVANSTVVNSTSTGNNNVTSPAGLGNGNVTSPADDVNGTGTNADIPLGNYTYNATTANLSETDATLANSNTSMYDDTAKPLTTIINDFSEEAYDEYGLSFFREALIACELFDQLLGDTNTEFTVFAPTNGAIKANKYVMLYLEGLNELPKPRWSENLKAVLLHHIIPNVTLSAETIYDNKRTLIDTMLVNSTIEVSQFTKKLGGAGFIRNKFDIDASNGMLHVVDHVLSPEFLFEAFNRLELQPEFGPDVLGRVSLVDVAQVSDKSRTVLTQVFTSGLTFAGCRIRAFNRLEEYLPQTINHTPNVTTGELMNASFGPETRVNLLEYSLIAKNYYFDDIPDGYLELVTPLSGKACNGANMWITKKNGVLCFNNGCTINTPNLRTYLASNGVGYVIDKCQVCLGIAMLANIAAEYTVQYNLRDISQFFVATLWNLRNLSESVGDGTDVTLFASVNSGWASFNLEDVTRLASDEWHPHKLDLCRHMMVQGRYTYGDLYAKYQSKGPFNLTSLAGQPLQVDYDSSQKSVTLEKGKFLYKDILGVDGIVHFTDQVPLPMSMTMTTYDYAKVNPNYSTQITLIDSMVNLAPDMKRLLPLTCLFAPDPTWENLKIELTEISTVVLENMIFKSLLWCDTLRAMRGQYAESHNQKYWSITINKNNMPCFQFRATQSGNFTTKQACITKCDILARNGIVHEIDTVLLYETPETLPPEASGARLPGMAGDNYSSIIQQTHQMPSTTTDGTASSTGTTGSGTSGSGSDTSSAFQRPSGSNNDLKSSNSPPRFETLGTIMFLLMAVATMSYF